MITDFAEPGTAAAYQCDICIIGSGAAGIAMALELADSRVQVCLLESGGFEFSGDDQALYDGESIGQERASPLGCRLRYFGGTTNHWTGMCAPLQERDFDQRDWVPESGWPIRKSDLHPYYIAAQKLFDLAEYGYEPEELPADEVELPALNPETVAARYWQFSPPTRFGRKYRERLTRAANIHLVLHANVVRLNTDDNARVLKRLEIRTLAGRNGTVDARLFVLACGGMENARLLLHSDDVQKTGLGNGSGFLGRYFMQHPEHGVATFVTSEDSQLYRAFARKESRIGRIGAHLTPASLRQRQQKLLNTGFDIFPVREFGPGYEALRDIVHDVADGEWPAELDRRIWTVLSDLDGTAAGLYRRSRDETSSFRVLVHLEQMPNSESRVSLAEQRDPLGMRKVRVNWQLTAEDKRSILESTLCIGEELARLKLARLKLEPWLLEGENTWPDEIWSGCHQMGTTRMSDDPRRGIVDRNCRVHSVHNLYVAGSSVFPTSGYVPPTFTIVALALRLAKHLREQLK